MFTKKTNSQHIAYFTVLPDILNEIAAMGGQKIGTKNVFFGKYPEKNNSTNTCGWLFCANCILFSIICKKTFKSETAIQLLHKIDINRK
jgi:hypothetical protein